MTIMNLWEYSGKHVRIIDVDNRKHMGFVEFYTSELDDFDGVASISLRPYNTEGFLIDFTEPEIAGIEIITANSNVMPVAV